MVLAHNVSEGLRTHDIQISQDVTFESMLLSSTTLQGLQESGFYKPSPVQLHAIPLGKCGFDLLLEAKSGTGKTAVFSVIALEKLDLNKGLQVVILAPTREIASQICDVIRQIGMKYEGLNVAVVMGGLPVEEDIVKFKKNVHIVVGSPGRLRHLVQDKYVDVSFVRLLVFDEADRLVEKSFLPDINFIFSILPPQKQVILSSATYTENTKEFIKKYVKSAQHVCPDSNCVLLGVEQKITLVKFNANIVRQTQNRFDELLKIISTRTFKQCLIFCNYQARVTEVHKLLTKHKWPAEQLYGKQDQIDRLGALKTLQEYKCRILIATDLAARGIDASNVDLIVNFEPPFEWQTYLHRIGRAGRFGSYGMSITILSEGKEEKKFRDMVELLKVPINIELLWTSSKQDLELASQIEPQIMNTKHNLFSNPDDPKLQELWNQLTGYHQNTEIIESFEILCESFEETKTENVESFEDLLKSFQSDQVIEKPNEYQHLQSTSQEIEKFNDSLKLLKEDDSKLYKNVIGSIKGCSKTENVSSNMKTEVKEGIHCDEDNSKKNFNKTILKKNCLIEAVQRHRESNSQYLPALEEEPYMSAKIKDTKELSSAAALMDAGFPVQFGCAKDMNKHISNNFTTNRNSYLALDTEKQTNQYHNLIKRDISKTKICYSKDDQSKHGLHNENRKSEELTSIAALDTDHPVQFGYPKDMKKHISNNFISNQNSYLTSDNEKQTNQYHSNTKTDLSKTKIYYYKKDDESENGLHYKNRKSYHSPKDEIEDPESDSDDSDYYANENYVNWYNQFKFRMRQIELAFYIEEMSHL